MVKGITCRLKFLSISFLRIVETTRSMKDTKLVSSMISGYGDLSLPTCLRQQIENRMYSMAFGVKGPSSF